MGKKEKERIPERSGRDTGGEPDKLGYWVRLRNHKARVREAREEGEVQRVQRKEGS